MNYLAGLAEVRGVMDDSVPTPSSQASSGASVTDITKAITGGIKDLATAATSLIQPKKPTTTEIKIPQQKSNVNWTTIAMVAGGVAVLGIIAVAVVKSTNRR